jgi:hypothetical protein
MANSYITTNQFCALFDWRTAAQLSNDMNSRQLNAETLQLLLDIEANEMEATITGRYDLLSVQQLSPMSGMLTKYVGVRANCRLWSRRSDRPKAVDKDEEWADKWKSDFELGKIIIPGLQPAAQPVLENSNSLQGRSRWADVYGQPPSPTAPDGQGWLDGNNGNCTE